MVAVILLRICRVAKLAGLLPPRLRLIRHPVKGAQRRLSLALVVMGIVVNGVLHLPRHIVVGLVQEPDQPVDLVSGLLAESPYGLKSFFGGNWRGGIEGGARVFRG